MIPSRNIRMRDHEGKPVTAADFFNSESTVWNTGQNAEVKQRVVLIGCEHETDIRLQNDVIRVCKELARVIVSGNSDDDFSTFISSDGLNLGQQAVGDASASILRHCRDQLNKNYLFPQPGIAIAGQVIVDAGKVVVDRVGFSARWADECCAYQAVIFPGSQQGTEFLELGGLPRQFRELPLWAHFAGEKKPNIAAFLLRRRVLDHAEMVPGVGDRNGIH